MHPVNIDFGNAVRRVTFSLKVGRMGKSSEFKVNYIERSAEISQKLAFVRTGFNNCVGAADP